MLTTLHFNVGSNIEQKKKQSFNNKHYEQYFAMKKLLFSNVYLSSFKANIGIAILRIYTGVSMAFGHGINKIPPSGKFAENIASMGFPAPNFFSWAAGISEFGGGLLIALGLMTRPASFFLGVTMFVAAFIRHGTSPFMQKEKALLFLFITILLILVGAGKYSIDRMIHRAP